MYREALVRVVWPVLLAWAGITACTPFIPVKDDFGTSATAPVGEVPPEFAEFNAYNPGINPLLLERVAGQVDELGLLAVLFGPLKGIPYKIYAVEWGKRGGGLFTFLLISIRVCTRS